MNPRPNNRVVQAGDTVTCDAAPGNGVVGASTKAQAHRAIATVREVLGRDPKRDDIFVGGTRLISRPQSEIQNPQSEIES
jgi:hypothetical protein